MASPEQNNPRRLYAPNSPFGIIERTRGLNYLRQLLKKNREADMTRSEPLHSHSPPQEPRRIEAGFLPQGPCEDKAKALRAKLYSALQRAGLSKEQIAVLTVGRISPEKEWVVIDKKKIPLSSATIATYRALCAEISRMNGDDSDLEPLLFPEPIKPSVTKDLPSPTAGSSTEPVATAPLEEKDPDVPSPSPTTPLSETPMSPQAEELDIEALLLEGAEIPDDELPDFSDLTPPSRPSSDSDSSQDPSDSSQAA